MAQGTDCTFCGVVTGDVPSTTIAQTERAVAFMDTNPVTHGHALVVPRVHATDLLDIAPDDLAACSELAQDVARRAKDRLGANGVNLLNCSGADAWQTVFHFHLHVVPRFRDEPGKDALGLPWNQIPGDPQQIREIGRRLS